MEPVVTFDALTTSVGASIGRRGTCPSTLREWRDTGARDRRNPKALSTLSQKSATVAENGETTAAVAKFGDSRTFLRQYGQAIRWTKTDKPSGVGGRR